MPLPKLTLDSRPIQLNKIILILIILILLAGNLYFAFLYLTTQKELLQTKTDLETQKTNEKVLNFTQFFIKEVLKTEKETDFETRLKLENGVRSLNDEQILAQWNKFVNSKGENEAQDNVKELLELLVGKIKI